MLDENGHELRQITEIYIRDDGRLIARDNEGNECAYPSEPIHKQRWNLMSVWIVGFTLLVLFVLHQNRGLADQNKHRITDIQQSRIAACQSTYTTMQSILLASVGGKKGLKQLPPARQDRFKELLNLADPDKCRKQTAPNRKPTKTTRKIGGYCEAWKATACTRQAYADTRSGH